MPTGLIEIQDEVNVRFLGVPKDLIVRAQDELTYWVPNHKHMPAFKMGRWDGKIRLMGKTGKTYLNLVDRVLPVFEDAGYEFEIDDFRDDFSDVIESLETPTDDIFADHSWPDGTPIMLRDYQLAAVKTAIESGQGLLEMATGAGKTLTCAAISKIYGAQGKVVVIVPNIDLAIQTQGLFNKVGLEAGIWYGEMKDARNITISTWQSLDHYPELFAGVVCTIVDEAHQAKAKTLSEIMTGPAARCPFRFGCTGTVPKDACDADQIKGVIGDIIFQLTAYELQQRGVLASAEVFQLTMVDSKNPKYISAPAFEEWSQQMDWLFGDPDRMETIAAMIQDAADVEGNVLVLIPYKKHGKMLQELLPGSVSLDGDVKGTKRQAFYEEFNAGDNNILICTFGIASTGLDIPRINVLCFLEPGKKFEKIIQTVGRGLRKAADKDHVIIMDVCSDTDYSKKHATERRRLYKDAKIECHRETVDYVNFG